jgi:hypothetical protein
MAPPAVSIRSLRSIGNGPADPNAASGCQMVPGRKAGLASTDDDHVVMLGRMS